jgi:hypothetical protein
VKRMDLWRAKLKAAKAERRIVARQYNQAERALNRLSFTIEQLENKLGNVEKHQRQDAQDE